MSQSGHFRAHGRRDVDLSAALDPGDTGPERDRVSTVPAAPDRASPVPPGRQRPSGPAAARDPGRSQAPRWRSDSPANRGRASQSPPAATTPRIRILNLSLGGACIELAEAVPLGTTLTLEIVAPTLWDPLVLRGHVVWSRSDKGAPPRAGLSFEHSDAARAFALFELLGAHDFDA